MHSKEVKLNLWLSLLVWFLPNNGLASAFLNKTWFEARSNILIENDRPGDWSPEKDCCWRVAF